MTALQAQALPRAAPARVLACGAFLKNRALLLDGRTAWWSPLHGDLAAPEACLALEVSLATLVERAHGRIDAVAHDLHPDFPSTHAAIQWAQRLGVPALPVQHHHAHLAVVQAEGGLGDQPLIGLALDGFGLGADGLAWGGEVMRVQGGRCERMAHLPWLPQPGGDAAAREPWRLAAAVLHAAGRADEIATRFAPQVGEPLARGVRQLLERDLHCPRSSSAGRWFDAAAALLGLSLRQAHEADAAMALEAAATRWLASGRRPDLPPPSLDLLPLVAALADEPDPGRGAARFHLALAQGQVRAVVDAAAAAGATQVALGGGCFANRLLTAEVTAGLQAAGLTVHPAREAGCGDAGLALGQAWVVALQRAAAPQAAGLEAMAD